MTELFRRMVEEESAALLRWAYAKTGQAHQAEELAQEVWLQFFSTVKKEKNQGARSCNRSICCGGWRGMCGSNRCGE